MKKLDKNRLEENLRKRISADIESGKVSGASICVLQNGETAYKSSFGFADIEEKKPIKENSLFRMASMSKPITAVGIMILHEKGLLSIYDPISKYLDGFENMNIGAVDENGKVTEVSKAENDITIEMLLSHSAGIGSGRVGDIQMSQMTCDDKRDIKTAVNYYKKMLLDFNPGEYECYSPVAGFDILAEIIEAVTKEKFSDFVTENIFKPLKMNDTTFTPTEEQWERIVQMSDFKDSKAVRFEMPKCVFSDFPSTYICGGAGVVSCIGDYVKFAEMLRCKGIYNNVRILSDGSVENIKTVRFPVKERENGELWGLGVRVNRNGFYKNLPDGSFGWSGAYGTHFWIDTENGITAVYMKNSMYDGGSGAETAFNFEKDVYECI